MDISPLLQIGFFKLKAFSIINYLFIFDDDGYNKKINNFVLILKYINYNKKKMK